MFIQEPSENIEISFRKAIELNPDNVCSLIKTFGNSKLDIRIPETFFQFISNCSKEKNSKNFNIEEYAKKNSLDFKLVSLINNIQLNDEKYRFEKPVDWNKQRPLDHDNQKLIDSLFSEFNTYIGNSLVGEKYESVMWAVVQHSNLETMEKYIPIIQDAVKEEELNIEPFKMLIDRYYGLKFGYQIFGSQSGVELANEKKRKEIKLKYEVQ